MQLKFMTSKERWLSLTDEEVDDLEKLRLGAEGERLFANCLEPIDFDEGNCRALMDWRLKVDRTTETQIDALLLMLG